MLFLHIEDAPPMHTIGVFYLFPPEYISSLTPIDFKTPTFPSITCTFALVNVRGNFVHVAYFDKYWQ